MKTVPAAVVFFLFALSIYGQSKMAVSLDEAISGAAFQIQDELSKDSKIVVHQFQSHNARVSDYVLEKLFHLLVNSNKFDVLDRTSDDVIEAERYFQFVKNAGMIDDGSLMSLTKKIGAQAGVTGSLKDDVGEYRFTVKVIGTETIQVLVSFEGSVPKNDKRIIALRSWDELHDWNHIYSGARAGLSLGNYVSSYPSQTLNGNPAFDASVYVSWSIWSLFALQAEALYTSDTFEIVSRNTPSVTVSYNSLMIPLLAKLVWRPTDLVLQGYAGAYLNLPVGQMEIKHSNGSYNPNLSHVYGFMAGGGLGKKLGPGYLMAEIRYARDFNNLTDRYKGNSDVCRRNKTFFALGYECGFLPK